MALGEAGVVRLQETRRQLLREVTKKGGNAAHQLRQILPVKALKASRFAGARRVFARGIRQHLEIAEDIAARKVGSAGFGFRIDHLDHPAVDDVEGVAGVARGVNRLVLRNVAHLRKSAQRLQLQREQGSAKGKEISRWRPLLVAGVVQTPLSS